MPTTRQLKKHVAEEMNEHISRAFAKPSKQPKRPTLTLINNKVDGWDELDSWAYRNVPQWNHVTRRAFMHGLSETEKLQLLSGLLLEVFLKSQDAIMDMMQRSPVIFTPSFQTQG